jgi:hypothetical protein
MLPDVKLPMLCQNPSSTLNCEAIFEKSYSFFGSVGRSLSLCFIDVNLSLKEKHRKRFMEMQFCSRTGRNSIALRLSHSRCIRNKIRPVGMRSEFIRMEAAKYGVNGYIPRDRRYIAT